MFCTKCGKQLSGNEAFCTGCGNRINTDQQATVTNESVPEMTEVPDVGAAVAAASGSIAKPKAKSNKGLVITISICAAVLVILIGVILGIMFLGNGGDTDTPVPSSGGTTQPIPAPEPVIYEIDEDTIASIAEGSLNYTDFGVYVKNLRNGYTFGYNDDLVMPASAMCQVVILDTLSKCARDNSLDMKQEDIYFSYMPNGKEAPDSRNENGDYLKIQDCIEDVAVYGDNNKSNLIVDYIGNIYDDNGFNVINKNLVQNGYYNTKINRKVFVNSDYIDKSASPNVTTAGEIGEIFNSLINSSSYGSPSYMKNIFKSISNDGKAIGLKKYIPGQYEVCNVNGLNSQSTNDVALISDGDTSIVVAILSCTREDKTKDETNDDREDVQEELIEYIIETQFESGDY